MKTSILLTGLAIITVMTILYFNVTKKQPANSTPPTPETPAATSTPAIPPAQPTGKIKADTFTGILQSVDTGCFADGECSITVDGKHVTLLVGRSQEVVGTIEGVQSIGDLEAYIGKPVEVYARDNSGGAYSLYGSEGFHIKVVSETASSTQPNKVTASTTTAGACVTRGCSGELCVDANTDARADVTTCLYKSEYACYKTATCTRQKDGNCGWTDTPALSACLQKNVQKPTLQ